MYRAKSANTRFFKKRTKHQKTPTNGTNYLNMKDENPVLSVFGWGQGDPEGLFF